MRSVLTKSGEGNPGMYSKETAHLDSIYSSVPLYCIGEDPQ